jgi:hypothetical protein
MSFAERTEVSVTPKNLVPRRINTSEKEQSSHVMLKVVRNQFRRLISTHQLISR